MIDFLLRDQLLGTCSRELYLFLKEKCLMSVHNMATIADQYAEARGGVIRVVHRDNASNQSRGSRGGQFDGQKGYARGEQFGQRGSSGSKVSSQSSSGSRSGDKPTRKCFTCGGNHYANECQNKGSVQKAAAIQVEQRSDPDARQSQNRRGWQNKEGRSKGRGQKEMKK